MTLVQEPEWVQDANGNWTVVGAPAYPPRNLDDTAAECKIGREWFRRDDYIGIEKALLKLGLPVDAEVADGAASQRKRFAAR